MGTVQQLRPLAGGGPTGWETGLRILVADDHDLVRETMAAFLTNEGFATVRTAATLDQALTIAQREAGFDLVLLDYSMPGMNGLEGLARMIAVNEGRPVAILSGTASRDVAEAALKSGAAGFIPKTLGSKSMMSAARFMVSGEVYMPADYFSGEAREGAARLTAREIQVLRGIAEGKSNKEIALDHDLQEVTVKLHVKTLTRKLGARNRTHAAMLGRDQGLL